MSGDSGTTVFRDSEGPNEAVPNELMAEIPSREPSSSNSLHCEHRRTRELEFQQHLLKRAIRVRPLL
jgi:hypothetical protein